jgi:cytochrome c biogenesis protein CcdA
MFEKTIENFQKKSLKERFLLVMGILFFLIYLTFGLLIMFWEKLPLNMPKGYRIALGGILIIYSFLRFLRFFNRNNE